MRRKHAVLGDALRAAIMRIRQLDRDKKVQFIILYGSAASGGFGKTSDIDLAVGYAGSARERFEFRKRVLGELGEKFDVQIFQDLPVYVRMQVLKGRVLYMKDARQLHDIAYDTIKEFGLFKRRFLDYIRR